MQNRNELTLQQLAYLKLLALRTRPLNALEYATFLKFLELESLYRFVELHKQRQKEKRKQHMQQYMQQKMQEILQQARQRRQKRKQAPKRRTIAQAWKLRQDERLAVWTKRRLAGKKKTVKQVKPVVQIDTTCITGSTSTNRQSPVMSEQVKYELMRYYRNQN